MFWIVTLAWLEAIIEPAPTSSVPAPPCNMTLPAPPLLITAPAPTVSALEASKAIVVVALPEVALMDEPGEMVRAPPEFTEMAPEAVLILPTVVSVPVFIVTLPDVELILPIVVGPPASVVKEKLPPELELLIIYPVVAVPERVTAPPVTAEIVAEV